MGEIANLAQAAEADKAEKDARPSSDEEAHHKELQRLQASFQKQLQEAESRTAALNAERTALRAQLAARNAESESSSSLRVRTGSGSGQTSTTAFEIDLEDGTEKHIDGGCLQQADVPLQGFSRRLAMSTTWRRAFFSYVGLLQVWVLLLCAVRFLGSHH